MPQIEEIFKRQNLILDPTTINSEVWIFGVGTGGSHLTYALSKMGFKIIHILDYDTVEPHNVANQFFKIEDIGRYKIDAIAESVSEFSPYLISILKHDVKFDENTEITILDKSIVILAFDTLPARKLVWNKIKGRDVFVLDARMTGELFRVFSGKADDEEFIRKYEESLNPVATIQATCGTESIIYNILGEIAILSSIVKKMVRGESFPYEIDFSFENYEIMVS